MNVYSFHEWLFKVGAQLTPTHAVVWACFHKELLKDQETHLDPILLSHMTLCQNWRTFAVRSHRIYLTRQMQHIEGAQCKISWMDLLEHLKKNIEEQETTSLL